MDNLLFVSRSSILDFTCSLGHVYPIFGDHKYERYFKLGCDSVFSNRRYSMSWRTSYFKVLHWVRVQEGIFLEDLSGLAAIKVDLALWKEGWAKRARIVIQGNCCLCYGRVLHQETHGSEIKDESIRQSTHWQSVKCVCRVALAYDQALINSEKSDGRGVRGEWRNTVAMTVIISWVMTLTIPRPTGGW